MSVINRAYADDSRRNDRIWVVGGYMGHDMQWRDFELRWEAMLKKHGVPYFHMKEMAKPNGVYAKWHPPHEHETERAAFFKDLTHIITDCWLRAFFSIVRIDDLEKFNSETGANLQPYPLAVYGCMLCLATEYKGVPIEVVFDRIEKITSKLAMAMRYAESDVQYPHVHEQVMPSPLAKPHTFRQVRPLQAADFLSWELQKQHHRLEGWFLVPNKPTDEYERSRHLDDWSLKNFGSIRPPARRSLDALIDHGPTPAGIVWTYENLWQAHRARGQPWA